MDRTDNGPLILDAPAKINLFLQVVGRRDDGYHELISLMCAVGLFDRLTLSFDTDRISVSCDDPDLPGGLENLAGRAADLFFGLLGRSSASDGSGVSIRIEKRIPVAAGLGGGSSDAAAVLAGLNHRYGRPFSLFQLLEMGRCLGADVPFFLHGGPALARGIGERLTPVRGLTAYPVVLVCPKTRISTAQVYNNLNLGLTKCGKKLRDSHFEAQKFDAERHLCNDLESVTLGLCPDVQEAKNALMAQGAVGALMSGSGPTVFGLFSDSGTAGAACTALLRDRRWPVYRADMLDRLDEDCRG